MTVERCGIELGQTVDLVNPRVDAIGDGDVDETVVGAQRDRRLGALLGEGVEPGAGTAAENDAEDGLFGLKNGGEGGERGGGIRGEGRRYVAYLGHVVGFIIVGAVVADDGSNVLVELDGGLCGAASLGMKGWRVSQGPW